MDANRRIVAVIGMHRSGTSVVTRGLRVLGVDLGERLMPASPGINEKGFWEDLDLHALSEALLGHLGRTWHDTVPIPEEALTGSGAAPFASRAAELLRAKMAAAPLFGFKDPRTARLLPFWKRVFETLGVEASYVIALRHPMSVADSLAARNGFAAGESHRLWLQHMAASLQGSAGRPRVVVSYDRLMDDPAGQLQRIADMLGLAFDAGSAEFAEYAGEFLDDRLRHWRHAAGRPFPAVLAAEADAAYRQLERLAAAGQPPAAAEARHPSHAWPAAGNGRCRPAEHRTGDRQPL